MMLCKLISAMKGGQFETSVVALSDGGALRDQLQDSGASVHCLGMKGGLPDPIKAVQLIRIIRAYKPDLVHAWMLHGCIAVELARPFLQRNVPILWNFRHSLHDLSVEKPFRLKTLRWMAGVSSRPKWIVYNSKTSAQQHEGIGYSSARTKVIPNGFDCDTFAPDVSRRDRLRAELNVAPDDILIGITGRVHPVKDHTTFLNAAGKLARRYANTRFAIVGRGAEPANDRLSGVVESECLANRIILLGERHDMPAIYNALDIASCTSVAESFPNVLGEAMACGVPCVATDVGDSAAIVGSTGRIVPTRNPDALCEAWGGLIEMGKSQRGELGRAARLRIQQSFGLSHVVRMYEELYREVVCAR